MLTCKCPASLKSLGGERPLAAAASPRSRRAAVTLNSLTASSSACNPDTGFAMTSRRGVLLAGLAVFPSLLALSPARAAEALSPQKGAEEYSQLETAGKLNTPKALDAFRAKYNFKRGPDGRVLVKGRDGTYYMVRLDMEAPSVMLLRNTSTGEVYALQAEGLAQIDLTSDELVIMLLGGGTWEDEKFAISYEDADGKVATLKLSESDFRNLVGLVNRAEDGEEEEEGNAK